MKTILTGFVVALGLAGLAWGQDGKEKGKEKKELSIALKDVDLNGDGRASVTEIKIAISKFPGQGEVKKEGNKKEGNGEGGREGNRNRREKGAEEPSMPLKDLDKTGKGRATLAELQAALESLTTKKEGDRK